MTDTQKLTDVRCIVPWEQRFTTAKLLQDAGVTEVRIYAFSPPVLDGNVPQQDATTAHKQQAGTRNPADLGPKDGSEHRDVETNDGAALSGQA